MLPSGFVFRMWLHGTRHLPPDEQLTAAYLDLVWTSLAALCLLSPVDIALICHFPFLPIGLNHTLWCCWARLPCRAVAGVMADWALFSDAYLMMQHVLFKDRYRPTESAVNSCRPEMVYRQQTLWHTQQPFGLLDKQQQLKWDLFFLLLFFCPTLPRQTSFGPEPRRELSW